jgi:hypothetical protein
MHIGYFEYGGKTYFFGRASDGTVTAASELEIDVEAELKSIEDEIRGRSVETNALNPSLQAHPEQSIHKLEHDYFYKDWVEGFVILSLNDPEFGLVYLVFQRSGMTYQFRAKSRDEAIQRCIPGYRSPNLKH